MRVNAPGRGEQPIAAEAEALQQLRRIAIVVSAWRGSQEGLAGKMAWRKGRRRAAPAALTWLALVAALAHCPAEGALKAGTRARAVCCHPRDLGRVALPDTNFRASTERRRRGGALHRVERQHVQAKGWSSCGCIANSAWRHHHESNSSSHHRKGAPQAHLLLLFAGRAEPHGRVGRSWGRAGQQAAVVRARMRVLARYSRHPERAHRRAASRHHTLANGHPGDRAGCRYSRGGPAPLCTTTS